MSDNQPPNQPSDSPSAQPANLPEQPATSADPGSPSHPDPRDLVLYAMQLLNSEEAAAIARHLERCAACRAELAHVFDDLAACALTVELEPLPALARQRLLQQVAREKKIAAAAPAQLPLQPVLSAFGRSAPMDGDSVVSIDSHHRKPSAGRTILAFAGWAAAAALAVAFTFLYKDRQSLNSNLASENAQIRRLDASAASSHQLLDALTDPKSIRVALTAKPQPKTGPIGGVTYNPDKGTLVFLASNLDPLQSYKTYELWVIPQDGTAPIPAGTFHPDDQGNASVIMPDLPKGVAAKAFGVTIEDNGGSQTPTLPIVMAGS